MKKRLRTRKKHYSKKVGMPPGTPIYIGDVDIAKLAKPKISKIAYNATELIECELNAETLATFKQDKNKKLWLNVHGVHDVALIKQIGELFKLHPLVVEDILNTEQRPKIDEYEDYIFLETRNFYYEKETMSTSSEQISMVLGRNFLLTFQERSTGAFEPVRQRLRANHAHTRAQGVDYLAYALLDSVVEGDFKVLEDVSNDSEDLEDRLLAKPNNTELHNIHQLKLSIFQKKLRKKHYKRK